MALHIGSFCPKNSFPSNQEPPATEAIRSRNVSKHLCRSARRIEFQPADVEDIPVECCRHQQSPASDEGRRLQRGGGRDDAARNRDFEAVPAASGRSSDDLLRITAASARTASAPSALTRAPLAAAAAGPVTWRELRSGQVARDAGLAPHAVPERADAFDRGGQCLTVHEVAGATRAFNAPGPSSARRAALQDVPREDGDERRGIFNQLGDRVNHVTRARLLNGHAVDHELLVQLFCIGSPKNSLGTIHGPCGANVSWPLPTNQSEPEPKPPGGRPPRSEISMPIM